MKASVDKEACIGCGLCESICSSIFYMDNDGKANTKITEVPQENQEEAKEAESSCPTNAIIII